MKEFLIFENVKHIFFYPVHCFPVEEKNKTNTVMTEFLISDDVKNIVTLFVHFLPQRILEWPLKGRTRWNNSICSPADAIT